MIHFTCDRCGCSLSDERFEAKIEVAPAFDPDQISEEHLVADNLEAIAEELNAMDSTSEFELDENEIHNLKLDLCPRCVKAFLAQPVAPVQPQPTSRVTFSNN